MLEILLETSERHTPNDQYENFAEAKLKAVRQGKRLPNWKEYFMNLLGNALELGMNLRKKII